tara:strand:+ start:600 stop:731 length:132 start_codon:yes stop_codon:yes gene_type:complete
MIIHAEGQGICMRMQAISQLPEFSMNENPLKRAALYFLDLVNG